MSRRGVKGNTVSQTISEILDRDIDVSNATTSIQVWNRVCRTVCRVLLGLGYLRVSPHNADIYHWCGRAGVRDMWFLHEALSFTTTDTTQNLTHVCLHAIQTQLIDKEDWTFKDIKTLVQKRRPHADLRRIYDILNVLFNMRLITRVNARSYKWIAKDVIKY